MGTPALQLEKIRKDAHHTQEECDGSYPLSSPGHEAVAQYLATPKSLRNFRSDSHLAKHFEVSRMTVYRWKQIPDVIKRALWLSKCNQFIGDMHARQEWPRIMKRAVQMAIQGNINAIRFCEARAWAEKLQVTQSQLSASILIEDLLGTSERNDSEDRQISNQKIEGNTR